MRHATIHIVHYSNSPNEACHYSNTSNEACHCAHCHHQVTGVTGGHGSGVQNMCSGVMFAGGQYVTGLREYSTAITTSCTVER